MCRTLGRNAFATNRDLTAVVGNKISERSVSVSLARAKPRFTAKVVQDQEPEELSEEWKTEAKQWLEQVKRIPLDKMIYEDETPVYANEAPKKGRSPQRQTHISHKVAVCKKIHAAYVCKKKRCSTLGLIRQKRRYKRD